MLVAVQLSPVSLFMGQFLEIRFAAIMKT